MNFKAAKAEVASKSTDQIPRYDAIRKDAHITGFKAIARKATAVGTISMALALGAGAGPAFAAQSSGVLPKAIHTKHQNAQRSDSMVAAVRPISEDVSNNTGPDFAKIAAILGFVIVGTTLAAIYIFIPTANAVIVAAKLARKNRRKAAEKKREAEEIFQKLQNTEGN